jgi:hypothetical protein
MYMFCCKNVTICSANTTNTVIAYADDTVLVNSREKAEEVTRIFQTFEAISGAHVNYNKTMAINIRTILEPPWLQIKEQIKTLVIIFGADLKKAANSNCTSQLTNFGKWSSSTQAKISTYCNKLFCATLSF